MAEIALEAYKREARSKGETHKLRRMGKIPGILYGKGVSPLPIHVEGKSLIKTLKNPAGLNAIFKLEIKNEKPEVSFIAMIKDIQRDYLNETIIHVDFHSISLTESISVLVPVRLLGTAKGVNEGGVLQQNLHKVKIECLPTQIPPHIDVDTSELGMGDSLFVRDLTLPEGVTMLTEEDAAVVTVVPHEVEEVPAETVAPPEGAPLAPPAPEKTETEKE